MHFWIFSKLKCSLVSLWLKQLALNKTFHSNLNEQTNDFFSKFQANTCRHCPETLWEPPIKSQLLLNINNSLILSKLFYFFSLNLFYWWNADTTNCNISFFTLMWFTITVLKCNFAIMICAAWNSMLIIIWI